jgi:hypothetical protein
VRPLSVFPFVAPVTLAAALCGCSETLAGVRPAVCSDLFDVVYPAATDVTGTPASTLGLIRTSGDTLIAQLGGTNLVVFPPDGSPTTTLPIANPSGGPATDLGGLDDFWVDGSSFVLVMGAGIYEMPLTGGALTTIATTSQVDPTSLAFAHDTTTLYSAIASTDTAGNDAYLVRAQSLSGGANASLATVPVSRTTAFGVGLFDEGDALWLADGDGDVFSIAKSGGPVSTVGHVTGAGTLFSPNGTNAFYGSSGNGDQLESLALTPGGAAWQWPSGAPSFFPGTSAVDSDGTAYFAGTAYSDSHGNTAPAFVVAPKGQPATSIAHCGASGWSAVSLAVGDTVLYATVTGGGGSEIVRLPK